ncbi:MAG: anhydro-N-acetylmuramic acid kinase, partial [Pseudomonadota bacterium]
VNIGGISNATFVFENQDPIAFDCGPGNALVDQWMEQQAGVAFDDEGTTAADGNPDEAIIARYLSSPFFSKTGPKSLDRNDFALDGLEGLSLADGAATLSKLTASAIVASAKQQLQMPETFIIAGGGARNKEIMRYIREGVGNHAQVMSADQAGFDADMMEAEAWAYLAVRSLKGLPLTFPSTTGCREPVTGGVLAQAILAS